MMKFHLYYASYGYTLENVLCTADGENLNTITEENGSYTFIMPGKKCYDNSECTSDTVYN